MENFLKEIQLHIKISVLFFLKYLYTNRQQSCQMHRMHFYQTRHDLAPFWFTNSSNLCLCYVDQLCFFLQDFYGSIGSILDCINYGGKSFPQIVYFPVSSCLVIFANYKIEISLFCKQNVKDFFLLYYNCQYLQLIITSPIQQR